VKAALGVKRVRGDGHVTLAWSAPSRGGKERLHAYVIMSQDKLVLTFFILFAGFVSQTKICGAEDGIKKRSIHQSSEDAEFIRSLSEQLYKRVELSDENWGKAVESEIAKFRRDNTNNNPVKRDEPKQQQQQRGSNEGSKAGPSAGKEALPTPMKSKKDGVEVVPLVAEGGSSGNLDRKTWHLIIFAVCGCAGAVVLIGAAACYYNMHSAKQKAKEEPYKASSIYGEYQTMPSAQNLSGIGLYPTDHALAQSAQKFHYQHQKEKLIAMENENNQTEPISTFSSDLTDEVYETAGLAPMWDVEADNPLYTEDVTPGTTPRDSTPIFRTSSGGSGENVEAGSTPPYVNGDDASEAPRLTNGPKSPAAPGDEIEDWLAEVNTNAQGANADIHANIHVNGVNGVNGEMNGINGYH